MKRTSKILIAAAAASGAALTVAAVTRSRNHKRQHIAEAQGTELKEYRNINGVMQFLYHRSENIKNPVILYLHGGPGEPAIPSCYLFQRPWEARYTVVHWDQRLCGKTLQANASDLCSLKETITVSQLIADTREIINYLRQKYHQDKIILLGHSWGSILGSLVIREMPELISAYIGVGQVVSMRRNEEVGYQKALQSARVAGSEKDVADLKALQPYPPQEFSEAMLSSMMTVRRIQRKYRLASPISVKMLWQTVMTPDYSLKDLKTCFSDTLSLNKTLLKEMMDFDLEALNSEVQVPVGFILGDHDWQTPYPLAQEYFKTLIAPRKKLILIPDAGHSTMIDQPQLFWKALDLTLRELLRGSHSDD